MKPFESFVMLRDFIEENELVTSSFSCYVNHWLIRVRRKMTCEAGKWYVIGDTPYESI